jgi:hypothetical protein
MFMLAVLVLVWVYGVVAQRQELFPEPQLMSLYLLAKQAILQLMEDYGLRHAWWYTESADPSWTVKLHHPDEVSPGYLLVSGIRERSDLMAKIMDNQGRVIHEWDIDWFRLWPDPVHLPDDLRPQRKPGSHIHGIVFMPNGDLVFNFERLGLMRLGYCGEVVWRLPRLTNHSLHVDDDGNLWVLDRELLDEEASLKVLPNYTGKYLPLLLEVSPDGELKQQISVYDLLLDNGLGGLLYLSSLNNWGTSVSGDLLHVNDVEPFSGRMRSGFFQPGDLMISLRNSNAVIVFNKNTGKIKFVSIGKVLRQHDPDFLDGDTIAVLDNNNLSAAGDEYAIAEDGLSSRIVLLDARSGAETVYYEGTPEHPFFTNIMGKEQWLENGNLLITETRAGHAFELDPQKQIVWEYQNLLTGDFAGYNGLLDEVQRLPEEFDEAFFSRMNRHCEAH